MSKKSTRDMDDDDDAGSDRSENSRRRSSKSILKTKERSSSSSSLKRTSNNNNKKGLADLLVEHPEYVREMCIKYYKYQEPAYSMFMQSIYLVRQCFELKSSTMTMTVNKNLNSNGIEIPKNNKNIIESWPFADKKEAKLLCLGISSWSLKGDTSIGINIPAIIRQQQQQQAKNGKGGGGGGHGLDNNYLETPPITISRTNYCHVILANSQSMNTPIRLYSTKPDSMLKRDHPKLDIETLKNDFFHVPSKGVQMVGISCEKNDKGECISIAGQLIEEACMMMTDKKLIKRDKINGEECIMLPKTKYDEIIEDIQLQLMDQPVIWNNTDNIDFVPINPREDFVCAVIMDFYFCKA